MICFIKNNNEDIELPVPLGKDCVMKRPSPAFGTRLCLIESDVSGSEMDRYPRGLSKNARRERYVSVADADAAMIVLGDGDALVPVSISYGARYEEVEVGLRI